MWRFICNGSKWGAVTDMRIQLKKKEKPTHEPLQMWKFIIKKAKKIPSSIPAVVSCHRRPLHSGRSTASMSTLTSWWHRGVRGRVVCPGRWGGDAHVGGGQRGWVHHQGCRGDALAAVKVHHQELDALSSQSHPLAIVTEPSPIAACPPLDLAIPWPSSPDLGAVRGRATVRSPKVGLPCRHRSAAGRARPSPVNRCHLHQPRRATAHDRHQSIGRGGSREERAASQLWWGEMKEKGKKWGRVGENISPKWFSTGQLWDFLFKLEWSDPEVIYNGSQCEAVTNEGHVYNGFWNWAVIDEGLTSVTALNIESL